MAPHQKITLSKTNKEKAFKKTVLAFYKQHGRHHLPWRSPLQKFRRTKEKLNPYRILVSEVMLQQTQVDRVIPYYRAFIKQFPTVAVLAEARLGDVLRAWAGLGYNRRAQALHEAAKTTMIYHSGRIPPEYEKLCALPGVGEYTAKAVRVFAFNEPETMVETNIRAVFLHHFFPRTQRKISDKEVVSYMIRLGIPKNREPREWYAALMDYGAHLKKTMPNPSQKSAHHVLQKPFKGSNREIRGAVLKSALSGPRTTEALLKLPFAEERIREQVAVLVQEGLMIKRGRLYTLP